MSESLVVNSKSEVCVVKTPPVDLLLKRCGNPVCFLSSTQMVSGDEMLAAINPDIIEELYRSRATKALASSIESRAEYLTENNNGYMRIRADVVAMRPAEFEDLIDAVYRAGLEDGAVL